MNINALKEYKSVDLRSAVEGASPHELISMLFKGTLEALAKAAGAIERKDVSLRTQQINKASDIIVNLKGMLNLDVGGEFAANLDGLYNYMLRSLMQANRDNNAAKVKEVAGLVSEVFQGWIEIPAAEHQKTSFQPN